MAKKKKKPLSNSEKIALAMFIFRVLEWLSDLLLEIF